MKNVLREEKKYLLNEENYLKTNNYFNKVLHSDKHNGKNGYMIRSLYFDTINDDDFYNKIDGLEVRRKIRLRIYDCDSDIAYLEMKQKRGNYQQKRSLTVSKEDALELIKKNYDVLLNYEEEFAKELYVIMKTNYYVPKTINEYYRIAYVQEENSIRLTFDRDIRATETNFDLFNKNLVLNPVFNQNLVVFEVKYNGFLLSYIKDIISRVDKIQTPVSKYCLGRTSTIKYIY